MRVNLYAYYRLHRTLGWLLILPLMIITVSGMVLVFVEQLRDSVAPYSLAEPVHITLSPSELVDVIQKNEPKIRLKRLYLPRSERQAVRALLQGDNEKPIAFLHPGTGTIISLRDASEKDWLDNLYQLHQGKWLGTTGQLFFTLSGSMVFIFWLSGLRLYKAIPGKKKGMRYHRQIGFTLGGCLAAFALCGALLNYAAPLQRLLKPAPAAPLSMHTKSVIAISELLVIANAIYPSSPLERVYIDHPVKGVVLVRFQDSGRLYLNRQNGQCLQQEIPLSHWLDWLYPLHSGRVFDMFRYPILLLIALSMLVLTLSGTIHIWRRRQSIDSVYLPNLYQKINLTQQHKLIRRRLR